MSQSRPGCSLLTSMKFSLSLADILTRRQTAAGRSLFSSSLLSPSRLDSADERMREWTRLFRTCATLFPVEWNAGRLYFRLRYADCRCSLIRNVLPLLSVSNTVEYKEESTTTTTLVAALCCVKGKKNIHGVRYKRFTFVFGRCGFPLMKVKENRRSCWLTCPRVVSTCPRTRALAWAVASQSVNEQTLIDDEVSHLC